MLAVQGYDLGALLYESEQTRVYGAIRNSDQMAVVIKEYRQLKGGARQARCEWELAMLARLENKRVAVGVEVVGYGSGALLVVQRVQDSRSLLEHMEHDGVEPLSAREVVVLAIEVTLALAHVHRRGLIHKDLKPANVMVDRTLKHAVLIDFGTATDIAQEAEALHPEGELAGSLHYLPPEQTGRTATALDYRADYYGLGCTLYHLLSGAPPFAELQDESLLIHAQLARKPATLNEVPGVPGALASVVAKLMHKAADARYQGARGLLFDLRRCLQIIDASHDGGDLQAEFTLAQQDRPERLILGARLYGRQEQTLALTGCLEGLEKHKCQLVLVQGKSGAGKTALVRQQLAAVHLRGGRYAEGKFDMLNRSRPYAAVLDIIKQLVASFTAYGKADQCEIRRRMALVDSLATGLYLVPDIGGLVAESACEPTPPPAGEQGRLRCERVLCQLPACFCLPDQPLVLFIDDMQWADRASIELLKSLLLDTSIGGILVIASNRSDEVGPAHPWAIALDLFHERGLDLTWINVPLLTVQHTTELLGDCLQTTQGLDRLAELTFRNTAGNPYFIAQFLQLAVLREILRLDEASGEWTWDLDSMAEVHSSDNVVDLLLQRLRTLSPEAQALLMDAAALSDPFDLSSLATVEKRPLYEVAVVLEEGLRAGLIRTDSRKLHSVLEPNIKKESAAGLVFRFAHDRVRTALYGLLGDDASRVHGKVVKHLWRDDASTAFRRAAVHHGRLGRAHIKDAGLRLKMAQATAEVGNEALATGIYDQAERILAEVPEWLTEAQRLGHCRELFFNAALGRLRAARLCGKWSLAWGLRSELDPKGDIECAEVDVETVYLATVSRTLDETVDLALAALARQGLPIGRDASKAQALALMVRTKVRLQYMGLGQLKNLPVLENPRVLLIQRLLGVSIGTAYQLGLSNLYTLMAVNLLRLSLDHGISAEGVEGLALYSFLEMVVFRNYALTRKYSDIALELIKSYDAPRINANVHCNRAFVVEHWMAESRSAVLNRLRDGFLIAVQAGDDHTASATLSGAAFGSLLLGQDLSDTRRTCVQLRDHYEQSNGGTRTDFAAALIGLCDTLADGRRAEVQYPLACDVAALPPYHRYYAHGMQLLTHVLWHDYSSLMENVRGVAATKCAGKGVLLEAVEPVLVALGLWWHIQRGLKAPSSVAKSELKSVRSEIQKMSKLMASWASGSPALASSPSALCRALALDLEGASHSALGQIELAMSSGRIYKQPHFAGLAAEVGAELALRVDDIPRVIDFGAQASRFYRRWGAQALALRLGPRLQSALVARGHGDSVPELMLKLAPKPLSRRSMHTAGAATRAMAVLRGRGSTQGEGAEAVGYGNLLASATMQLSELTERNELLSTALGLLLADAGATGAMIFEVDSGRPKVIASTEIREAAPGVIGEDGGGGVVVSLDPEQAPYPATLVERAIHSGCVTLPNASRMGPHTRDPYFVETQTRSALCVAVRRSGTVKHAVYLENRDVPDIFQPMLVESIAALTGPLSIALGNAQLFSELAGSNAKLSGALKKATAADAAKSVFLANMSHELRTPMNGIMGNAEMLSCTKLSGNQSELLQHVQASGEILLSRIASILDFAQLMSGDATLSLAEVELPGLLGKVVERSRHEAEARGIALDVDSDVPVGTFLRLDAGRVSRLLEHLLENAMKHSKAESVQVICRYDTPSKRLTLKVRDNGIGMDATRVARLFEFFEQGDGGSTKKVSGIGLGLSTVRQLVGLMGGDLVVDATPGKGACFTVGWPAERVNAPVGVEGPIVLGVDREGHCNRLVMIVEDNKMNLMIAERTVRKLGYEVVSCLDGLEAVQAYAKHAQDLAFILMDCQMPNMDGYEATGCIREAEAERGLAACPIIAVTANALEGDKEKCLAAGMDRFLPKPLRPKELKLMLAPAELAAE